MIPPPPRSTLFPYTTLFRSSPVQLVAVGLAAEGILRPLARAERHHIEVPGEAQRRLRLRAADAGEDRKSTRLNSSHPSISYAVFCLKKKKTLITSNDGDYLR